MATFANIQTTEAGQVLLAQVHAGSEQLTITGMAFGSGIWTEEERAARNLTALKNEVLRVAPSGGEQAGGVADITCVLTNATLETGFALTELGVIAKKADDTEVLYMVDSVEAPKSTWISPASEHLMQIPVELRIACSSTSQINIRIESTAPVTDADLDRHNNASGAHPDIRQELAEHNHDGEYYTQRQVDEKVKKAMLGILPAGTPLSFYCEPNELPEHWYFRNGELVDKTSSAGQRLLAMSGTYKLRHGITETATHISLPNAFNENGDGYFDRPVDGVNRQAGSVQKDAFQDHEFASSMAFSITNHPALSDKRGTKYYNHGGGTIPSVTNWDATASSRDSYSMTGTYLVAGESGDPRIADETRPTNYGSTPAVFLPPVEA